MTDASNDTVSAVPEGYHAVTPWIISRDSAGLIAFLEAAFGAVEIARVQDDNGVIGEDASIEEMRVAVETFEREMHGRMRTSPG